MAVERESSFGDEQTEMRESQNEKRKKKWKLKRNKTISYLRRERMRARAQHTNGTQHQLLLSIILLLLFLLFSSCDIHIASFRFEKVRGCCRHEWLCEFIIRDRQTFWLYFGFAQFFFQFLFFIYFICSFVWGVCVFVSSAMNWIVVQNTHTHVLSDSLQQCLMFIDKHQISHCCAVDVLRFILLWH